MPPETPQDESSHLPNADSTGGLPPQQQHWKNPPGKTRTRIGPAQSTASPSQIPEEPCPPAELSPEWQELLEMQEPEARLPPLPKRPSPTVQPAPTGPKRSVIAPKSPPAAITPPQQALAKPALRRSLIARRADLPPEPPQEAPAPPHTEPPPAPPTPTPAPESPTSPENTPAHPTAQAPTPKSPAPNLHVAKAKTQEPSTDAEPPPKENPTEEKKTPTEPESPTPKDPAEEKARPDKAPTSPDTHEPVGLTLLWKKYWDQWGGRALAASLGVHALLLLSAAWVVVSQVQEKQVDFLSGGGTQQEAEAAAALQHRIQQKKNPWLKKPVPMRKLAVANSLNSLVLPDDVPDLLTIPETSSLLGGGKLGGGMGLAGSGGGFGKGMGIGGASGVNFQPFSLFGMQVRAKKLAAVLDVSGSMAPHLPRVIAEVDKVAKGSVVVLYIGCGIEPPPPRGLEGKNVISTSTPDFEKFWRLLWQTGGATQAEARSYRPSAGEAIQNEEIYNLLKRRPRTYFIFNVGIRYAWLALLSDQVREADGLYWFSDFQDPVNFRQLGIVRDNLVQRKQRLYAHSYFRGSSFDLVRSQLVESTQGDYVLEE